MYDEILVPTDGSEGTARAIEQALTWAEAFGAAVHALYVVDTRPFGGIDLADEEAVERQARQTGQQAVTSISQRAADAGIEVTQTIQTGVPHAAILDYIENNDVGLVVMGTHGRTGSELAAIGSTTERVLHGSDVPVVTVAMTDETGPAEYDDILVPTDGSAPAERAAEHAIELAVRYESTVHALYVVDTSIFEFEDAPRSILGSLRQGGDKAVSEIETMAAERSLSVQTTVAEGQPYRRILDYADDVGVSVIALGRRGRTGRPDVLLGSVTARVARLSEVPVMSVT